MRYSKLIGKTKRQKMQTSNAVSHQLLLKAGFITPVAAGIYSFLPLGFRVLEKVDHIIKEELEKRGVQHLIMPFVHPAALWKESGRFGKMKRILAVFKAQHGGEYLLAPTHEETVTDIARKFVISYKDLPCIVNQNQWKYRDEIRVNAGLLRTREFLMQDAYSFDIDEKGLEESFALISDAYKAIFLKMGFETVVVKADSGAIGGSGSEEFMVLSSAGEDKIIVCDSCQYKANLETAESISPSYPQEKDIKLMRAVLGKGIIGVEELAKFLNIPIYQTTKTLLYQVDNQVIAVCVRGEYQINETKLHNYLKCTILALASEDTVKKLTKAKVGYAGPVGLPKNIKIIWDLTTKDRINFEAGANKTDYHNLNVNFDRDVTKPEEFIDVRLIKSGENCIKCKKGKIKELNTIELGHVFKLGTIYSEAMAANFIDKKGKSKPIVMGCYGIGMTRILSAAIEQHHDDKGIMWPKEIAPFLVQLISLSGGEKNAEKLYHKLMEKNIEVLWDDRDESAGVKFADADLIGIPIRLVVSNKTGDKVELKYRNKKDIQLYSESRLLEILK
ncbi:proline--tRNA ligase [Candidatus Gottesmanbacteria bacterium RBG_16_37_8]|uniref:Proline--tRNA ligase n=1 Tax=Candidatus Gottesmanbacteria bacterium RBG_16_37_8 TaxID=1798371 RepID=A0A1F5YTA0_9BACT|nr:MAG: proline--tRNA ligase [Candidatus Gottesmanbacteria bacterium RBG_16_37_8]